MNRSAYTNPARIRTRPLPLRWVSVLAILLLPLPGCHFDDTAMVSFVGSPVHAVRAMLDLAKVGPDDVVYDLGSGDGRILIIAAQERGARGVGIEIDPKLVAVARENARRAGVADKVKFIQGDIFAADIHPATVVTLYLYETVNQRLRPKLLADLAPGTRVVSLQWRMGDWKPDAERRVDSENRIYLWRIPARKPTAAPYNNRATLGTRGPPMG